MKAQELALDYKNVALNLHGLTLQVSIQDIANHECHSGQLDFNNMKAQELVTDYHIGRH